MAGPESLERLLAALHHVPDHPGEPPSPLSPLCRGDFLGRSEI
jgi:hypothetical protein